MSRAAGEPTRIGEVIAAAFDAAAPFSRDAREVARLATMAARNILRRAGRTRTPDDENPLYATLWDLCPTVTALRREEHPRFPSEYARSCAHGSYARSYRRAAP